MDDTHSTAGPLPRPSFVVIGADAFLAARPATPVQVVHACSRAGYDAAVPATWGDELIAARCVERLADRSLAPAIFCACSLVRDRLMGPGPDLLPFVLSFVSPPVATARYLRQLYAGRPIDITFVGACPSADDEVIDRVVTPVAFFAELRARGISLSHQPTVFDSTFAPDRRRSVSQPGGLPAPGTLDNHAVTRRIIEIGGFEYAADLAQHLILSESVLLDISARAGCACAGAAVGVPPLEARRTIVVLEPPRSAQPIVEPGVQVMIDLPLAPPPGGDNGPRPPLVPDTDDADTGDAPTPVATTDAPAAPAAPVAPVAPATRRMERRHGERRRVFDHTFDMQFDSAFRDAFNGAAADARPIQPAEPLVAVAERSVFESVREMRRADEAAMAVALAPRPRRASKAPAPAPAPRPAAVPAPRAALEVEVEVAIDTATRVQTLAIVPITALEVEVHTPEFDTATIPGFESIVRIPVAREPTVRRAIDRGPVAHGPVEHGPIGRPRRPARRPPRMIEVKRRPAADAWHRATRWLRRIPASTYIVSFAAVTAAAVFVGITVRARHTFQLTAVQQPPQPR